MLAVLKAGGEGEEKWGVAGERVLATVEKYVDGFKELYAVNEGGKRKEWNGALALGRYTGECDLKRGDSNDLPGSMLTDQRAPSWDYQRISTTGMVPPRPTRGTSAPSPSRNSLSSSSAPNIPLPFSYPLSPPHFAPF